MRLVHWVVTHVGCHWRFHYPGPAGYEGKWPSFVLLTLVRQVFVVMEQLISSDVTEPQRYGSQCVYKAQCHARQVMCIYSLLMRVNILKTATVQGLLTCVGQP